MSLLMDALRKAEDAKRRAEASAGVAEAAELTLEPLNAPAPRQAPQTTRLPDLAEHSAALDAGLSAVAREAQASADPSTSKKTAALRKDNDAARNVFAAKTGSPAPSKAWPVIVTAGISAALIIAAYFWWQLHALSGSARPLPVPLAATPATPLPTAETAPSSTAAATTPSPLSASAPPAPPAPPAPSATTQPTELPRALTTPTAASTDALPAAPVAAPRRVARTESPPAGSTDAALQVRRTRPAMQNVLELAFEALQAGRLDDAQRGYEQSLRSDAQSTDALLGLATIATRQGRHDQAQAYYMRALEADPSNATAQAGLLNGRGYNDPGAAESRLKGALDAQPESSALLFALGNLYARQARWSEAQQAYFRAYAAEPDNADLIFNLAVALDHLRQNKLAAQYYQMALNAARAAGNSTLFDRDQARVRIQELQP